MLITIRRKSGKSIQCVFPGKWPKGRGRPSKSGKSNTTPVHQKEKEKRPEEQEEEHEVTTPQLEIDYALDMKGDAQFQQQVLATLGTGDNPVPEPGQKSEQRPKSKKGSQEEDAEGSQENTLRLHESWLGRRGGEFGGKGGKRKGEGDADSDRFEPDENINDGERVKGRTLTKEKDLTTQFYHTVHDLDRQIYFNRSTHGVHAVARNPSPK